MPSSATRAGYPSPKPLPATTANPTAAAASSAALSHVAFPTAPGTPAHKWVISPRLQLRFALPDRDGWSRRRGRSRFLLFDHGKSDSHLAILLWTGDENMNHNKCETRARLFRELPARAHTLVTTRLAVPAPFHTRAEVGIHSRHDGTVDGYVLAFGAAGRRCFMLAFDTHATGAGAPRRVADRLATIQSLTLEKMQLRSGLLSVHVR